MNRTWLDFGPVLATLLAALAGLFLLHLVASDLGDAAMVTVWLLMSLVLARGLYRQARARRRLFIAAHVRADSPLQRLLGGRLFLGLKAALLAAVLGMLLPPFVVRLDQTAAWQLLLLHLPLAALAQVWLQRSLARHLSADYLPIACWRLGLGLNLGVLVILLAVAGLHGSYPDMHGLSLVNAVSAEVALQQAGSRVLLTALQLHAALDAIAWWLAQQLTPAVGLPILQLGGWLLLFGVKALFLWSYLLYLAGVLMLAAEVRTCWSRNGGGN
ncbi:hypothetical protein M0534_12070 [Methylonatrum kenyense]|uniref:hypothetical protein n=1 Tax=Methylonatrum kenyense TaxID=455253 RepID=UPI0020C0EC12|nr:hypothetical protein [Methylonatrum kenyense]MCK8517056.1 hypothetical protein [Methylonatrum kenyense]